MTQLSIMLLSISTPALFRFVLRELVLDQVVQQYSSISLKLLPEASIHLLVLQSSCTQDPSRAALVVRADRVLMTGHQKFLRSNTDCSQCFLPRRLKLLPSHLNRAG